MFMDKLLLTPTHTHLGALLRIMRQPCKLIGIGLCHSTVGREMMTRFGRPTWALFVLSLTVTLNAFAETEPDKKAQFLVATPSLLDPLFSRSVILMLNNDDEGALGIIVNRPSPATIARTFPHIEHATERTDSLYLGGPVQPTRIFVLMRSMEAPPAAEYVLPGVYVSSRQPSFDHALANQWPADRFRVIAGYAGWGSGQLGNELKRGDWRFFTATESALFDVPAEHLWEALTAQSRGQWAAGHN